MAENPAADPILDTIIPRSSGLTTSRIRFSTLATSPSVTDNLVPEGAFRFITNCAASVRGKKDNPREGHSVSDAPKTIANATNVTTGRRSTIPTNQSYPFNIDSNPRLNHRLKRAPAVCGLDCAASSTTSRCPCADLMNRAQNNGTTVKATI